jgi:hypothetical protein
MPRYSFLKEVSEVTAPGSVQFYAPMTHQTIRNSVTCLLPWSQAVRYTSTADYNVS